MWKATGMGFTVLVPSIAGARSPDAPLRPAGPHEPVAQADRGDVDDLAGVGGLDHLAVAHVHGHVLVAPRPVEEEVAGLEVGHGHWARVVVLAARVVRQGHAG